MAQLVIAAAGAAIGGMIAPGVVAFGMTGASIGWMAGSMIGAGFGPTQKSEGPRLNDLSVSTSSYGTPIPYVAGHPRVAGQIVWASPKREIATTESAGGKGGGGSEYTTYTYEVDLLILLTDNPISDVTRVWMNGELVWTTLAADFDSILASATTTKWQRFTVYPGTSSQLPDPTYEAAVGTANAPAYRGRGSVFIQGLQLGGSGQIPNLTFEVASQSTSTMWNGDFLLRYDTASSTWKNFALTTPTAIAYQPGFTNGAFVPVVNDAVNTLSGLTTARFSDAMRTTRTWVHEFQQDGAVFVPSMFIPFTGDVTIETYVYLDGAYDVRGGWLFNDGGLGYTFANSNDYLNQVTQGCFSSWITEAGVVYFFCGRGQSTTPDPDKLVLGSSGAIAMNTWTHVAFERVGVTWTIYINGLSQASGNEHHTPSVHGNFYIGGNWNQSTPYFVSGAFVGSMAEFRMTLTRAIYKANFQPPSAPLGIKSVTLVNDTLASTVANICNRTALAAGEYSTTALSTITQPVRAMAISQVSSARTVLEMLAQCYHFDAVLSDKIYFKPRAKASVATLTFDELGVGVDPNADPLPLTTANELEIPAQMALTYNNVDGDYQTDTQYSDRLLTGQESTSAITVPLGFTSAEAKTIVDGTLLDKAVSSLTTKVQFGITRAALEPTDVIVLTGDDASTYRMRVVKRTEAAGVIDLDCVLDDSTVFTQSGTTAGGTATQITVSTTPNTVLELLDIPLLRDADNTPGHYVAVNGSNTSWTNAALYASPDDLTYTQNTVISGAAVMGNCNTTLGAWSGGNVADESNTLTVFVGDGQLSSTTHEGMLSNTATNAALVGSEVIQFREATLVSAGTYTLRGLLRGRRGTEHLTDSHTGAELFVLLSTSGMRYITQQTDDIGKLVYYKAASAGQKLSVVSSKSITPESNSLKPFAPVNVRASRSDSGDMVLTWDRRTRLSESWLLGTLPLGESTESYEVEIYVASVLKRTISSTSPTATYTLTQQYTDTAALVSTLSVKVYQLSSLAGRGAANAVALTVPLPISSAGVSSPGATNIQVFPFGKAGSTSIAYASATYGSTTVHKIFESSDNGASFTQLTGLGAALTSWPQYRACRSDGVYVSVHGESIQNPAISTVNVVRGAVGSTPVEISASFSRPSMPVAVGCDGTNFVIVTEGNQVYTSSDGTTWTLSGTMSGLPLVFTSAITAPSTSYPNGQWASNYSDSVLLWVGSRWFLRFGGAMYYTTATNALTGWTACTLPATVTMGGTYRIASYSGNLFARGLKPSGTVLVSVALKSTDSGSTWTSVLDPMPNTMTDMFNLGTTVVAVGYDFAAQTSVTADGGASWTSPANSQTFVGRVYPEQFGTNIVIGSQRSPQSSDMPQYQLRYSSNGTSFSNSSGV